VQVFYYFLLAGALLSGGLRVNAGEVVVFKPAKKPSLCSDHLAKPSAQVLKFTSREATFIGAKEFLSAMALEPQENVFYLYSLNVPMLSGEVLSQWRVTPVITHLEHIYVLKVRAFDPEFAKAFPLKARWGISELREKVRFVEFTHLRVSPFFAAIKGLIAQVRGTESHLSKQIYEPVSLDESYVVTPYPTHRNLIGLINSWQPVSLNEEIIKEKMKELIGQKSFEREEKESLRQFVRVIEELIKSLYASADSLDTV
jgi:hypothetical protein